MLILVDNSDAIYQFTIVIIFITAILLFVAMYWYSISLQKSMLEQERTKQSLLINSHQLESVQLQNQILEAEKKAREEKTLRLQQEINLKNKELVTSTLMVGQQQNLMMEIGNLVKDLEKETTPSRSMLRKLGRLAKSSQSIDKNWERFSKAI